MKKVALYMRVSTDQQAREGESIPAQRKALRDYVDSKEDMLIAGEYIDDGVSGTKFFQRDELQRMLADVKARKIDVILFTKLDRFYRSLRHFTATQEFLKEHGVTWRAIKEPSYDTTTPNGEFVANQMMAFAQFEAQNTALRIKHVFEYKAQQGEVLSGNQPVGYSIVNKHLVLNEDAPKIKELFEYYAQHGNLSEATRFATEIFGQHREKHVIKNLLKNAKYKGYFRGNPSYCPPIVSEQLFEDVQEKLKRNIKKPRKYTHIFSGLIYCAECGRRMAACHAFRYTRKTHEKDYYYSYRCPKYYNEHDDSCSNQKVIIETTLEKYLFENIPDLVVSELNAEEGRQKDIKRREKQIAAIRAKLSRLKELYLNAAIDIDEYKRDRAGFEASIAELEKLSAPSPDRSYLRQYMSGSVFSVYEGLTREEKQQFWRSFIGKIAFSKKREITVYFL